LVAFAVCAALAPWLSNAGIAKSLEAIAYLNGVFLPTAMVVYMPLRVLDRRRSVATATTNTKSYKEKLWATEAAQSVELLK